jgi:two-component system CheB/CheR fusion protein
MVQVRDDLHKANELMRLAIVVRDSHEAITVQDLDGRILAWNPAATRTYGWTESEALQMNANNRIPEMLRPEELSKMLRLAQGEVLPAFQTMRLNKIGEAIPVEISATSLASVSGRIYAIATTERVISLNQ